VGPCTRAGSFSHCGGLAQRGSNAVPSRSASLPVSRREFDPEPAAWMHGRSDRDRNTQRHSRARPSGTRSPARRYRRRTTSGRPSPAMNPAVSSDRLVGPCDERSRDRYAKGLAVHRSDRCRS
jgi:hypothetical protein